MLNVMMTTVTLIMLIMILMAGMGVGNALDDDEGNVDDVGHDPHGRGGGGHGLDQPRPGRRDGHQCSCCPAGEDHGNNGVLNFC